MPDPAGARRPATAGTAARLAVSWSAARRLAVSWPGDALLAAVLIIWSAAYLPTLSIGPGQLALALVLAALVAGAVATRRRWPVAATVVAATAVLVMWPLGLSFVPKSLLGGALAYALLLITYSLAVATSLVTSIAGTALLAVSPQARGGFNPFVLVATIGAWLAGRVVLSRRKMTEQLEARNAELVAERELFAQESVRYERARIARELHDIVAHCLSVMVVQAGAGQRVADTDRMAQALESVAEAAAQAQTEIARLVELLGGELASGPPPGLAAVGELVRRAETAGLAVRCRFAGRRGAPLRPMKYSDRLTPDASQAAYRVVQEALTNALKHAPGAPIDITVTEHDTGVEVSVLNAAPRQPASGLERSGGRHGLAGMRERVTACGGSLLAGPTAAGGWQVTAHLPWPQPRTARA